MVTSTKTADEKVVTMSADADMEDAPPPAPPRTLLEDVNAHLSCFLCRGYYIDATTIVECLHSFCRSCIVKHLQTNTYCPVCEMMINTAKPNIKPDKALQDIVYKLVPGLFQSEMDRRRKFYSSRPGPAASATPEQRGEDTERIIFSPLDVISFSLEYAEVTDAESVSSRSSESGNEASSAAQQTRRYLQCPAVVNISHLKKFISMKFDIDCSQYSIDILYKRVSLLDYYTLMDIAYIFNWKRNEPMRFFYQILDYSAIRNRFRLFDSNRKGSHFRNRKQSPADAEDSPPLNDHSSDGTSGTNSPMPDDCNNFVSSKCVDKTKLEKNMFQSKLTSIDSSNSNTKSDSSNFGKDEIEKSEFLNSFHLAPKNSSPTKSESSQNVDKLRTDFIKNPKSPQKFDDGQQKRKVPSPHQGDNVDQKKQKVEPANHSADLARSSTTSSSTLQPSLNKTQTTTMKKLDEVEKTNHPAQPTTTSPVTVSTNSSVKLAVPNRFEQPKIPPKSLVGPDHTPKRPFPAPQNTESPKRRTPNDLIARGYTSQPAVKSSSSPTSLSREQDKPVPKPADPPKPGMKKIPDLKLTIPNPTLIKNKQPPLNINRGVRSDLLANNSDPIQDRSKILSQVKRGMNVQSPSDNKSQGSGDPLKSLLFDSCKINIPSSLSITLTDQKSESGNGTDANKNNTNKSSSLSGPGNFSNMKSPTPAVQNSIEIVKLPDAEPVKPTHSEVQNAVTSSQPVKTTETTTSTTAKGPMPSLKPISESKIGKQSTYSKPSPTFHQIFIQSLQNQQTDKTKLPKTKPPIPKLMPANPKLSTEPNKSDSQINTKSQSEVKAVTVKNDNVLDLSSPSQLGPHQKNLLETMQSIANLAAKKQNMPQKLTSTTTSASSFNQNISKPIVSMSPSLRMPSQLGQKQQKVISPSANVSRIDSLHASKTNMFRPSNPSSTLSGITNTPSQATITPAQSSPKSQTRSPSVSPKLVIAEDKQPLQGSDGNQSNLISSSQNSNTTLNPGGQSVLQPKQSRAPKQQMPLTTKLTNARVPSSMSKPQSSSIPTAPSAEMLHASQIFAQQHAFQQAIQARQFGMNLIGQMSTSAEWINKLNQARIENLYKSFSSVQQAQNEFNGNKDNKK